MDDCPVLAVVNVGSSYSVDTIFPSEYFPSIDLKATSESSSFILPIRCKYYEADIRVKPISDETDLSAVEAVLIHFDHSKSSDLNVVSRWMNLANESALELRILLCSNLSRVQKESGGAEFQQNLIKHHFELIELDPVEGTVGEGDQYGSARLKSAIEAHLWPNMKVLASNDPRPKKTNTPPIASPPLAPTRSTVVDNDADTLHLDETMESFERIMKTVLEAKQKIGNVDSNERHRLAEKVTMQFWRAFGDSDGSISDDDDDDDESNDD